jgi:hypothetical protein
MMGDLGAERLEVVGQGPAEITRQIGHALERFRSADHQPAPQLPGAQWRLFVGRQPNGQLFRWHLQKATSLLADAGLMAFLYWH